MSPPSYHITTINPVNLCNLSKGLFVHHFLVIKMVCLKNCFPVAKFCVKYCTYVMEHFLYNGYWILMCSKNTVYTRMSVIGFSSFDMQHRQKKFRWAQLHSFESSSRLFANICTFVLKNPHKKFEKLQCFVKSFFFFN